MKFNNITSVSVYYCVLLFML